MVTLTDLTTLRYIFVSRQDLVRDAGKGDTSV